MRQVRGTMNNVELIGRLGADPELRMLSSGKAVCRFRVATNRIAGTDEAGHHTYDTDWTSIEAWERLAEVCGSYLQKGRRVLVSGSLRTDTWPDKESGQTRSRTFVRADEVIFLDDRPDQPEPADEATDDPAF
jgi:single-strand DNA-binding protein